MAQLSALTSPGVHQGGICSGLSNKYSGVFYVFVNQGATFVVYIHTLGLHKTHLLYLCACAMVKAGIVRVHDHV